ncbi:trypsin-like peptidase domain-containing protein [Nonomuraea sp. NPDC050404]|uniref:nSTAND1 domain-containing NTPase n=1 Tax=Nonomuraea sp. NPDC050404 TaxID=3155783 RepID=UPI0033E5B1B4
MAPPRRTTIEPSDADARAALEAAVLQIQDRRGEPVGLGFLVTDELALTCAHVVSAALGTPPEIGPEAGALLDVALPLLRAPDDPPRMTASVEHWVAPRPSGAGDVAVLRLSAAVPGSRPIRLIEEPDVWQHPARVFGFPAGRSGGVWHAAVLRARQANGWVQADLAGTGYRVSRGFSGSPVWDEELGAVVGMMALAEEGDPPASYLMPTAGLLAAWPGLRPLALPPSPFRGLSVFEESDAALFHGRRTESEAVAAMVRSERWTAIVGPSGSGKSSLAQAGVVPMVRPDGTSVVVLRPSSGSSPAAGLAAELLALLEPELSETDRLDRLPKLTRALLRPRGLADVVPRLLRRQASHRLLIVIDQFEELLVHGREATDELAGVLFDEALPDTVRVLTTLRADFLGAALANPALGHAFDGRRVYALGPIHAGRLRQIVTLPVETVPGVRYEPHLVERILDDTGTGSGTLPLLSFALSRLWREQLRRTPGRLTHEAYTSIGGVAGALREHLAEVWAACIPEADEATARRLFTRLVRVPLESSTVTRRMATRDELGQDEWHLAQRLAVTRLLVIGRDPEGAETVELIHEALIASWDMLAGWAVEDRSYLVWRESLHHDRRRWDKGGRDPDLLPTAATLAASQDWLRRRAAELTADEAEYLELGRVHHLSRRRRRLLLRSGLAVLVVSTVLFSTLFTYAQTRSQERAALANSRALAQFSQDQAAFDPALSVKLALAAYETSPTQEARSQLLRQYLTYSGSARVLSGLLGTVAQFRTSRDGDVVFARTTIGRATLFVHALDGTTRSAHLPVKHVVFAMVSADGTRAAFVCENGTAGWFEVRRDEPGIIGPVHQLPKVPDLITYTYEKRHGFAMSADGRIVVVRSGEDLVWWDLGRNTVGGRVRTPADVGGKWWVGTDDRSLYMERSNTKEKHPTGLIVLDLITGETRTVLSDVDAVLVSGDRSSVAVCHAGESSVSYSLRRLSDLSRQGRGHRDDGTSFCHLDGIDLTGRHIVTNGLNDPSLVDLAQDKVVGRGGRFDGATATAWELPTSGGKTFLAAHTGSMIGYLDLAFIPSAVTVEQQVFGKDARTTVNVVDGGTRLQLHSTERDDDGDPLIAEARRPEPAWMPNNHPLKLDSDRGLLADWDAADTISVREVSTLRQLARITVPKPPPGSELQYFFDRGGHLVTVSGKQVQQWDASSGEQLAHLDLRSFPAANVGPYPADNQVAVLIQADSSVRVVDLVTGRTTSTVKVPADTVGTQFDPSGRYFAALRSGGVIELWQRDPLRKTLGPLRSVAEDTLKPFVARFLDGEGRYVVAANSSVRIYRVGDPTYRDSLDFGRTPSSSSLADDSYVFRDLSPDARAVVYQGSDNTGGPLRLDPALWRRELCGVIGNGEFTAEEGANLPVPVPARPLCPKNT